MSALKSIGTGFHLIKLLMNPEANIKSLIHIGDKVSASRSSEHSARILFEKEELEDCFNQKVGLEQLQLEDLKELNLGTFGKKVYGFYIENQLDVYPMKDDKSNLTRAGYISERTRKLHDFLHVLLGYGTDLIGEAKVNAFVASQLRMPKSFLILVGILVKVFFSQPTKFDELIEGIAEGWQQGNRHKIFLKLNWDELLRMSTEDVVFFTKK